MSPKQLFDANQTAIASLLTALAAKRRSTGGGDPTCDPQPEPNYDGLSEAQIACLQQKYVTYLGGLLLCNDSPPCCGAWHAWWNGAQQGCLI